VIFFGLFYAFVVCFGGATMATIEKRTTKDGKAAYRVKVRLRGFAPETATFVRLTDAKAWAATTEADMKAGRHFGQSKRHTFADLVAEYKPHAERTIARFAEREAQLDFWLGIFGNDLLNSITPQRIAKERDKLLAAPIKKWATPATGVPEVDAKRQRAKRSGPTVNRYLAALSACLSYGRKELQWLEKNPVESIRKPSENSGRVRFLSDDERKRLLEACRPHADLYLAVVLALTTGARQAEIMTLRFGQVDFGRRVITLTKTKNGETRTIPLVGEAFALLHERSRVRDMKEDRVFRPVTEKGETRSLRGAWESALKSADVTDFHWHDLRHTAASYLAMSGVSLVEIAKVLGHRTLQMVARYSHLADEHIVSTGEKLAARLGVA
jgi:integrase